MAYLSVLWKNSSSEERWVSMDGTAWPEGLWVTCWWQLMSLAASPASHQPGISHTGPQLQKCHWCPLTYIWPNELHYLFTDSSSSLVFKRLKGLLDPFLHKGLFWTAVAGRKQSVFARSYRVVITSETQHCSFGVWRFQQWLSLHRAVLSATRFVHNAKKPKPQNTSSLCRMVLWSEFIYYSPAIWLRPGLAEISNDVSCFALMSVLNHSCQNPRIQHIFNHMPLNGLHARFLLVPGGVRWKLIFF